MCIRDRGISTRIALYPAIPPGTVCPTGTILPGTVPGICTAGAGTAGHGPAVIAGEGGRKGGRAVSYTHLTLPTICSV
eukprot:1072054-Rhodomonas_salina.1